MGLSVFLLKDEQRITKEIPKIIEPSRAHFTQEQMDATLALMKRVASVEGSPQQLQNELMAAVETEFAKKKKQQSKNLF